MYDVLWILVHCFSKSDKGIRLQDDVIGILPKNLSSPEYGLLATRIGKEYRDHTSSSCLSLPPATVPLHFLTRIGSSARIYGNFANKTDRYN